MANVSIFRDLSFYNIFTIKDTFTTIKFANNGYYATKLVAHLSIFGYPSFCEIFMKFEKLTLHDVTFKYTKDIFLNKYLPIRIKGNIMREKYYKNLMTDAKIETFKLHINIINPSVNIIDQYTHSYIYKLLI